MLLKTSYKMKPPISARLNTGHPLADKLIACYLLNEGSGVIAHDSSGRGHHGTLTGGATWTMGKNGPAVDVDGTDGTIVITDHADFTPALHPFSIWMDVYIHDLQGFWFAAKYNSAQEWDWYTHPITKAMYIVLRDYDVTARIGRITGVLSDDFANKWISVVMTYNGGILSAGMKTYINRTRVDVTDYVSGTFVAVENGADDVTIGRRGSTEFADGVLSSIMIWRRVLTQSDIDKLYVDRFCMFERRT